MVRPALACIALTFLFTTLAPAHSQEPATVPLAPMAADAHPSFEVATIKPSDPNQTSGFPGGGRHVSSIHQSVDSILSLAYGIHAKQIVNAPEWLEKDRYDVIGVADVEGEPNVAQMQEMFQKLLADRFHLTFHREMREMPIYTITVAKGGPRLAAAKPGENLNQSSRGSSGQRILKFTNMPMKIFALNMIFYLDRPVIDQTGLSGSYDFTLTYTFDVSRAGDPDAAPSLFTAVKEQLGLEMEAVKGPAEVFVIDHVERPSEN